jgi:hypothetical protein
LLIAFVFPTGAIINLKTNQQIGKMPLSYLSLVTAHSRQFKGKTSRLGRKSHIF